MLGLASLSPQTKSIFQTLSVVPINCSSSEVMSGFEATTPSILFLILTSVEPTEEESKVYSIDISSFSVARTLCLYSKHTVKLVDM